MLKKVRAPRLTALAVERVKPGEDRLEISDGGGPLRLIIQPSGARSWGVRYRHQGQPKKLTLGPFPALSLAAARELCAEAMVTVAKGSDPATIKREARERGRDTVRHLVAEYVVRWQKPRNRTWPEVKSTLERVLVVQLGARDIREVTRRDLIRVLDGHGRKTLAIVRRFFNWCLERDLVSASPAAGIKAADPIVSRDRVLTDDELRTFLLAIQQMGEPWTAVFELLALTAQRRSEVAEATWSEIQLGAAPWTIAKERSKNGKAHVVPLAPRAMKIMTKLPSKDDGSLLFPAANGGDGAVSGFSKAKRRLDALMLAKMREAAQENGSDPKKVALPPWRIHDLRRTAATKMAALGHPIHVVERILNHVAGSTTGGLVAVYQRHDYAAERRAALESWALHLRELGA